MYRRLLMVGVLGLGYSSDASAQPAGDPAAGERKVSMCAGCHGIPGYRNAYPSYNVPKLGGQHAQYIVAALKAYQAKSRAHPTMQAIAAGHGRPGGLVRQPAQRLVRPTVKNASTAGKWPVPYRFRHSACSLHSPGKVLEI